MVAEMPKKYDGRAIRVVLPNRGFSVFVVMSDTAKEVEFELARVLSVRARAITESVSKVRRDLRERATIKWSDILGGVLGFAVLRAEDKKAGGDILPGGDFLAEVFEMPGGKAVRLVDAMGGSEFEERVREIAARKGSVLIQALFQPFDRSKVRLSGQQLEDFISIHTMVRAGIGFERERIRRAEAHRERIEAAKAAEKAAEEKYKAEMPTTLAADREELAEHLTNEVAGADWFIRYASGTVLVDLDVIMGSAWVQTGKDGEEKVYRHVRFIVERNAEGQIRFVASPARLSELFGKFGNEFMNSGPAFDNESVPGLMKAMLRMGYAYHENLERQARKQAQRAERAARTSANSVQVAEPPADSSSSPAEGEAVTA
jgi:hypothetical protein